MVEHLFHDKRQMRCAEFADRLIADGWKAVGLAGDMLTLAKDGALQTIDLRHDVGYCDPNGDSSIGWTPTPPGTSFSTIDEGTRQPDVPDTADYVRGAGGGIATDIYDMSTLTGVDSVSQVVLWAYGILGGAKGIPAVVGDVYLAGGWVGLASWGFTTSNSWKSITYNGSWTSGSLDAMQTKLAYSGGGNSSCVSSVFALYALVTYTASAAATFVPRVMFH